jgi:coenzyme F420-reducing hydrogenase delta subunit
MLGDQWLAAAQKALQALGATTAHMQYASVLRCPLVHVWCKASFGSKMVEARFVVGGAAVVVVAGHVDVVGCGVRQLLHLDGV